MELRARHRAASRIRVYLVYDEVLIRESLQVALEVEPDIEVVGQASDAAGALSDSATRSADVLLMNVRADGTDGIQETRDLKEMVPGAAIIMLSSYNGAHVGAALEAGVSGYVSKSYHRSHLVEAIHAASQGHMAVDPSLARGALREMSNLRDAHRQAQLTPRQLEILDMVARGNQYREIARTLFVSESTINREMRKLYDGLGVKDAAQAVSEAWRRGIL